MSRLNTLTTVAVMYRERGEGTDLPTQLGYIFFASEDVQSEGARRRHDCHTIRRLRSSSQYVAKIMLIGRSKVIS